MLPQQNSEVIDTLSKACAYGDFDKLKQFIDQDPAAVNVPDEQGYFPLQWAALNNRIPETTYLLSKGADINIRDHTGQTPLHWAAVRGSLPVIETLLRNGADPELRDNRGYTICHVAAQYGQTAVLYHLALKWAIDIDTPDADGRTALHWAAYKGYADTIRLLLVLDARFALPDKEGCTPLHWAAIKGNGEACTVLLQGGTIAVLSMQDVTGCTPPQLALEKGHRYLGVHLAEHKQKQESKWFGKHGKMAWLTRTQLCPVIWAIVLGLITVFVTKVLPHPPTLGTLWKLLAWSVVLAVGAGLMLLHQVTTSDPGFVPTAREGGCSKRDAAGGNDGGGGSGGKSSGGGAGGRSSTSSGRPAANVPAHIGALDTPALWSGNWSQLCVSCKIVRPLRAKHCAVTERCVEVFDHYCPWVGNTIGKGNRHTFLSFLMVMLYALVGALTVGIVQLRNHVLRVEWHPDVVWTAMFVCFDAFMTLSVAILTIAQASQVSRNVTTNELANWHRYKYLHGPDGNFSNPFNRGCKQNCIEAFQPHRVPMAPAFLQKDPESQSPYALPPPQKQCCNHGQHPHSHE